VPKVHANPFDRPTLESVEARAERLKQARYLAMDLVVTSQEPGQAVTPAICSTLWHALHKESWESHDAACAFARDWLAAAVERGELELVSGRYLIPPYD